jgi:hypothetical protein
MCHHGLLGAFASAVMAISIGSAAAWDDAKYPDLQGHWARFAVPGVTGQPSFDQTKPWGSGQQAPLTPEYRAIFEASLADQAKGGEGNYAAHARCIAAGMPHMMVAFRPLEFVVTPGTTYVLIGGSDHFRRIFTDGRDWPKEVEDGFDGYSIGKWLDTDGDGRFDTLEVETRNFKGPRTYEPSGIPLHEDNQSIIKERISLDKADRDILHNEISVYDHALTRPWTVDKRYRRLHDVLWYEDNCTEDNHHVIVGKEDYFVGGDGYLMPSRKGQPPPDLRYFKPKE